MLLVLVGSLEVIVTAGSPLGGTVLDFQSILARHGVVARAWHASMELVEVMGVVVCVSIKVLRVTVAHVSMHVVVHILGIAWTCAVGRLNHPSLIG